ncbi:transposase [Streptomyces inhibens]|uniref:transposase n=1 Tax=Streptomyces inhibens TaxID=2293571 RepID=UPI00379ABE46
MGEREPYLSDPSDEAWELVRPVIAAWKGRHPAVSGHEGSYEMREIVNAILYQARTGCQRRYVPHDLPPYGAVYYYFAKWRDDGTAETVHDLLRWQVRESRRRHEDPTAVVVVATSVHDNAIGIALLSKVADSAPTVTKAWTDAGFKNAVVEHGARLGIDVETVQREPGAQGFVPEPKRWVVEQTFGTLMLHRRLARDYETKPASSVAMIHWSMTDVMLRRLTRTAALTWRAPPASRKEQERR